MLKMPRFFLIIATLAATFPAWAQNELRSVADGLAREITAHGKKSVAVVDFTDLQGKPTALGRYLAEEFSVALTRSRNGFEVIDRAHLQALLTENKLATTGLIDPATAKKLGKIAGADALLTGTMTPFSESVRITLKVLNTDTATIVAADSTDLPKTTTINELLGNGDGSKEKSVTNQTQTKQPSNRQDLSIASPSSQVVVDGDFEYILSECSGRGGTVKCSFRVTNHGQDTDLSFNCDPLMRNNDNVTRAFDNFGNESSAGPCTLSNGNQSRLGSGVQARLISGVSVPASLQFANLSPSSSALSLITIAAASNTRFVMKVSFRNVPIAR